MYIGGISAIPFPAMKLKLKCRPFFKQECHTQSGQIQLTNTPQLDYCSTLVCVIHLHNMECMTLKDSVSQAEEILQSVAVEVSKHRRCCCQSWNRLESL
jgi:hypothetical protein